MMLSTSTGRQRPGGSHAHTKASAEGRARAHQREALCVKGLVGALVVVGSLHSGNRAGPGSG